MAYGSDVKLTQSTLSGNSAVTGGALYAWPGNSITVTGSVIANSAGGNCTGTITDNGGSRADDASCSTIPNTLTGLNATLAANGGPTMTHALMAGSSAIDAAGACGLATDQRGALRPVGPSCDSGSYEFGAILPLPGLSRWGLAALTTLSLLALSLAGIRHRNRSSIG